MTTEKLLEQARAHWQEATSDSNERRNRDRGREDAKFSAGGDDGTQWNPEIWTDRHTAGRVRPCITINKMEAFLHQVENEVRQNKVAIQISPVDSGIDKDTAEVDQGLIRHIENDSQADAASHAALVEACRSGLGALKVTAEYVGPDSFDQRLVIEHIPDAIERYWFDPYAKKVDRSDGRYAFEVERINREEFKAQYPDSDTVGANFFDGLPMAEGWISTDDVLVALYWYFDTRKRKLLYLEQTGQTVYEDELGDTDMTGVNVSRERDVLYKTVKCCKLNGCEILEETEFPGDLIPVVPVVGEEIMVDGQLHRYSLIHFAKDAQRLFNYYRSAEAEMVGLAPKAPWIGVEGQFEGHEHEWKQANVSNFAYLEYKNTSLMGQLAPPPARTPFNPQIEALSMGAAQANDDIKSAIGMFDASLGKQSNETSGRAILARQAEGDLANLHFIDNLKRSTAALGRIIVGAKNKFYDTPRTIEILGEDMKPKVVKINQQYLDPETGRMMMHPVADTRYNVTVSTGPSYTSQRQQAFEQLSDYVKAAPGLMAVVGDLIFRNSDMPGADQVADRLQKALPPGLVDDKQGAQQIPPQAKAQMDQMSQQIEQMTAALDKATDEARTKRLELDQKKLEMESKERIAAMENQTQILINERKIGSTEGVALLREDMAAIRHRLDLLHAAQTIEAEHRQAMAQQSSDQAQEQVMQGADQAHQRDTQREQLAAAAQQQQVSGAQAAQLAAAKAKQAQQPRV